MCARIDTQLGYAWYDHQSVVTLPAVLAKGMVREIVRYLLVSDIHSNLAAFDAVLASAGPFDSIWCMGDVIGYGPQPNECIERLCSFPHLCVAGNHDWAAVGKLDVSAFNHDALQACLWTREQLSPDNRKFIGQLPERIVDGDFTIVHGSPRHPVWEYITHSSVAAMSFACFDTLYCLFGHTHVPVVYRDIGSMHRSESLQPPLSEAIHLTSDRLLINPGGVGQPRDADPRASYAILDLDRNVVEYQRVAYPIEETQRLMLDRGLPPRLANRLTVGW